MAKPYLKRKERIIINAIDILDQGGINGLTMKEIARQQEITEPAVYRHFTNKQEVVLTILNRFGSFDQTLMNTITESFMKPDEAILYFIESYATYYQNYPQIITVLFSYDVYRYDPSALEQMKAIMERRNRFIASLVEEGMKSGIFVRDHSAESDAEMLLGQLWASMYQWKLDGCKGNLKERIMMRIRWMIRHMGSIGKQREGG